MKKEKTPSKKISYVQKYTFEITHYEDGTAKVERTNDGFSVIEMLGVATIITKHLMGLFETAVRLKPTDEVKIKSTNSPIIHKRKTS